VALAEDHGSMCPTAATRWPHMGFTPEMVAFAELSGFKAGTAQGRWLHVPHPLGYATLVDRAS
jgi:hypothetical protein